MTGNVPSIGADPDAGHGRRRGSSLGKLAANGEPSILELRHQSGVIGDGTGERPGQVRTYPCGRSYEQLRRRPGIRLSGGTDPGYPQLGFGQSLHVFWFDRNDANRVARTRHLGRSGGCLLVQPPVTSRTESVDVQPSTVALLPAFTAPAIGPISLAAPNDPNRGLTDVIDAVQPDFLTGYNSRTYCLPPSGTRTLTTFRSIQVRSVATRPMSWTRSTIRSRRRASSTPRRPPSTGRNPVVRRCRLWSSHTTERPRQVRKAKRCAVRAENQSGPRRTRRNRGGEPPSCFLDRQHPQARTRRL